MEGLVNYSSEDEQEGSNEQTTAVRGSPNETTNRSSSPPSRSNYTGNGTSRKMTGSNGNGRNSNYKDEDANKYKTSSSAANRSSSSYHSRGDNRDSRDSKDYRDGKDSRDSKDYRMNERSRYSKDYKSEHKRDRDTYGRRHHQHDDERSHNSSRHSSSHHKERHRDGETSRRHHRSHHDRHRRRSNSHSPSPSARHHGKRHAAGNDERPRAQKHDSGSRSQSSSPTKERVERPVPSQPLEQARVSAVEMERQLKNVENESHEVEHNAQPGENNNVRSVEALLALPLNNSVPKQPNVMPLAVPTISRISESAPIQLPSYYNPSVINPNKYAEQVQKRKLLWGAKKNEDTAAKWGNAQFSQDSDGKVASKFMRLMGIKGAVPAKAGEGNVPTESEKKPVPATDVKSREAMFSTMEHQYEVARQATHTMRGVGLGFGSQSRPF